MRLISNKIFYRFQAVGKSKFYFWFKYHSIVAGFENCIRAYILKDLKKFAQLQSCDNPHGIHAVAYDEEIITLATPHI